MFNEQANLYSVFLIELHEAFIRSKFDNVALFFNSYDSQWEKIQGLPVAPKHYIHSSWDKTQIDR